MGLRPDTDTALPRRLKDTVARAVAGQRLTPEKIGWFCAAFALPGHEEQRLLSLAEGSPAVRVLAGPDEPVVELPPVPPYRTLSLHEHHYLGSDGQPVRHSTTQVSRPPRTGCRRTATCSTPTRSPWTCCRVAGSVSRLSRWTGACSPSTSR
ncbi:MAG: hypothetical protein ACR2KN_01850 [Geodermatophilaceae bacterium]